MRGSWSFDHRAMGRWPAPLPAFPAMGRPVSPDVAAVESRRIASHSAVASAVSLTFQKPRRDQRLKRL